MVNFVWFGDFRISDPFSRTMARPVYDVWETGRQDYLMVLRKSLCLFQEWLIPDEGLGEWLRESWKEGCS